MERFVKVEELRDFFKQVEASERDAQGHVVVKYGGPCNELATSGENSIHVFYGAPCHHLDQVDFGGKEFIGLRYGAPCRPPYIIVKYGGPCAKFKP